MTPRLAPEQLQAPQVKPWHRHVISPLHKPASLPRSAPPNLVYSALQGWQKHGGIDGRRETRPRVGEAIDGAAVTTTGCALWFGARQLWSVVSLMNYPIIWANSGDGSRQRNSETRNGRKYCFISIRHLAHLTLEIRSAARAAIGVTPTPVHPHSRGCLEKWTSAHHQLL